jgi:hypothetical protein
MDLYSRRIVGWHISKRMTTDLIAQALTQAYWLRKPGKGLIFHSDRGSQYTSKQQRKLLKHFRMRASLGDVDVRWYSDISSREIIRQLHQPQPVDVSALQAPGAIQARGLSPGLPHRLTVPNQSTPAQRPECRAQGDG